MMGREGITQRMTRNKRITLNNTGDILVASNNTLEQVYIKISGQKIEGRNTWRKYVSYRTPVFYFLSF